MKHCLILIIRAIINILCYKTSCIIFLFINISITSSLFLQITIQPMSDERFLPAAHTCFNLLDLPRYKTRERLKYKLLQATQHNQGFSLVWRLNVTKTRYFLIPDCAIVTRSSPGYSCTRQMDETFIPSFLAKQNRFTLFQFSDI